MFEFRVEPAFVYQLRNIKFYFIKKNLFRCAIDFLRLEKVEIGGLKGRGLSARVVKIFEEFRDEFERLSRKKYEILSPDCEVNLLYLSNEYYVVSFN